MKIAIGIIIAALVAAIVAIFLLFVLRSHDLVLCGDIPQKNDNNMYVTRVYTYDVDANSTLTQIIDKMNSNTEGNISAVEMTEILSQYQTIVYAPVFTYTLTQEAPDTYVLTGSVFNGLDENGEPSSTDYIYKDLTLTVGVQNGSRILAAQNIYDDELAEEEETVPEFKERKNVIAPLLFNGDTEAAFVFEDCSSFRIVFTCREDTPPELTLVYKFDVGAQNLLNFSGAKGNLMGISITSEFDDMGRLQPTIEMNRKIIEVDEDVLEDAVSS